MPAPKLKLVVDQKTKNEIERLQALTTEELCAEYLATKAEIERLTLLHDLEKDESRRRSYKAFKKGHVLDGGTHTGTYTESKAGFWQYR